VCAHTQAPLLSLLAAFARTAAAPLTPYLMVSTQATSCWLSTGPSAASSRGCSLASVSEAASAPGGALTTSTLT